MTAKSASRARRTQHQSRLFRPLFRAVDSGPGARETLAHFYVSALMIIVLFGSSTAGWVVFEEKSPLDGLYASFETISTLGFGDTVPTTPAGKMLVILSLCGGFFVFAYVSIKTIAFIMEGRFSEELRYRNYAKRILKMEDHIIVCGLGRVGLEVIHYLQAAHSPFVVVDSDQENMERHLMPDEIRVIGDSTEDEVLIQAGIERAKGMVVCTPDDATNVFTTLSAKGINPGIYVIARAGLESSQEKLVRAGADRVVVPAQIGGRRMASMALRPGMVDLLETTFGIHGDEEPIMVEEIELTEGCPYIGQELRDTRIKADTGVLIVAIRSAQGRATVNPPSDYRLCDGDALVGFGHTQNIARLRELAMPQAASSA